MLLETAPQGHGCASALAFGVRSHVNQCNILYPTAVIVSLAMPPHTVSKFSFFPKKKTKNSQNDDFCHFWSFCIRSEILHSWHCEKYINFLENFRNFWFLIKITSDTPRNPDITFVNPTEAPAGPKRSGISFGIFRIFVPMKNLQNHQCIAHRSAMPQ